MTKNELDFHMALSTRSKGAARDVTYMRRAHFRRRRTRTAWMLGLTVLLAIFILQFGSSFARSVPAQPHAAQSGVEALALVPTPIRVEITELATAQPGITSSARSNLP